MMGVPHCMPFTLLLLLFLLSMGSNMVFILVLLRAARDHDVIPNSAPLLCRKCATHLPASPVAPNKIISYGRLLLLLFGTAAFLVVFVVVGAILFFALLF